MNSDLLASEQRQTSRLTERQIMKTCQIANWSAPGEWAVRHFCLCGSFLIMVMTSSVVAPHCKCHLQTISKQISVLDDNTKQITGHVYTLCIYMLYAIDNNHHHQHQHNSVILLTTAVKTNFTHSYKNTMSSSFVYCSKYMNTYIHIYRRCAERSIIHSDWLMVKHTLNR